MQANYPMLPALALSLLIGAVVSAQSADDHAHDEAHSEDDHEHAEEHAEDDHGHEEDEAAQYGLQGVPVDAAGETEPKRPIMIQPASAQMKPPSM